MAIPPPIKISNLTGSRIEHAINFDLTNTTVSSSSFTSLMSYTIEANLFTYNGQYLSWNGVISGNGIDPGGGVGIMDLKFYVGGNLIVNEVEPFAVGNVNGAFYLMQLARIDATTGLVTLTGYIRGVIIRAIYTLVDLTLDFTSAITLEVQAASTNNTSTITSEYSNVRTV